MDERVREQLRAGIEGSVAVRTRHALFRLQPFVRLLHVIFEIVLIDKSFATNVARDHGIELMTFYVIEVPLFIDGFELAFLTRIGTIAFAVHLLLVREDGAFQRISVVTVSARELLHFHLIPMMHRLVRL